MIKANDLRIGNWVNWTKPENPPTYEQVYILINDEEINEDTPYNYEPIPLTPEILEKAGFEVNDYRYYLITTPYYLLQHEFEQDTFTLCKSDRTIRPDIKYLHELQNIIYALTGKELEINL